ncbi:MAG TPA: acyl-CoA dehydrogenase family protein [Acidimicrobiia bacterium]|nr:acyl-CoA dehydrogenase family protein [Acidimicrobiia bacterium]
MALTAEQVAARTEDLLTHHLGEPESEFWGAQFDLGLAWIHFPEGKGGLGLDPGFQDLVDERLVAAKAPQNLLLNMMGVGMAGPTLVAFGTDEQQQRLLRPTFTCEEIWCQMFSEPGAGSDVASLATSAVRDGDEWVLNGQKVWTSMAHVARWGLLLVRTDPDAPKHRGLTYFYIDMHAPGVEIRPLRQMTGEAEFNEIFFTDVRIPDRQRIGEVGDGWNVAIATLMNERVMLGRVGKLSGEEGGVVRHALRLWRARDAEARDPVLRDRLVRLYVESEVVRLTMLRAEQQRAGGTPGPEGSLGRLMVSEHQQRCFEFIVNLLGAEGMLISDYSMRRPEVIGEVALGPDDKVDLQKGFLSTRGGTIGGGTTEISRNILGERVLGLPREPDATRDLPWSQIPRN